MRTSRLFVLAMALAGGIFVVQRLALAATNFDVTNAGATAYVIGAVNNPNLTLTRG